MDTETANRPVGRFAPTTSGRAHPGTLLAGLLAWLDIRSRHGRFVLRLEDIDPTALTRDHREGLVDDLQWFGLDWDELVWQSECRKRHERALDRLQDQGRLYECHCSRSILKAAGRPSAAGGWVYPGTCRSHRTSDWRRANGGLRVNLEGFRFEQVDEGGTNLSQDLDSQMGDPLVRRSDGGITYQLAVVVDDASAGVTHVVRGRDIATSTATQAALYDLLGQRRPVWRHHFLLLEPRGEKLAKLHQSIAADELRRHLSPEAVCGFLARVAGLRSSPEPVRPRDLLSDFSWDRVRTIDATVTWDGKRLHN